jgi:hypothetical protein
MKREICLFAGSVAALTLAAALGGCSVWPADGAAVLYPDGLPPAPPASAAVPTADGSAEGFEELEDIGPPLALPPADGRLQPPSVAPPAQYPATAPAPSLGDGGHALRYGSCLYYYAEDPNTANSALPYALYALDPDGGRPWRIFNAYYRGALWAGGGHVFTNNLVRGQLSICRINAQTGEVSQLQTGYLEAVDAARGRLVYTRTQGSEAGLYACDFDGGGEARLYQGACAFLGLENTAVYFSVRQGEALLLRAAHLDGGEGRVITAESRPDPDDLLQPRDIRHFGLCGDFLVYSYGAARDNGAYFAGDLVLVRKNGSDRAVFPLTGSETFFAAGGWLYYSSYRTGGAENTFGVYRVLPDASERQMLGQAGDTLLRVTEARLYFARPQADGSADLYRSDLDGQNPVLLYAGAQMAREAPGSGCQTYTSVDPAGEWVVFSVAVNAFAAGGDRLGGALLSRTYRVPSGGGEAALLGEQ